MLLNYYSQDGRVCSSRAFSSSLCASGGFSFIFYFSITQVCAPRANARTPASPVNEARTAARRAQLTSSSSTTSIADAVTVNFLNAADLPPTAAACSNLPFLGATYQDAGVYLPPARGLTLAIDLFDNAAQSGGVGQGVGYRAVAVGTSGTFVEVARNVSTGSAGLALLLPAATGSAVRHQVDYYGGFLTWSIGSVIVLSGVPASLPPSFTILFTANTGSAGLLY